MEYIPMDQQQSQPPAYQPPTNQTTTTAHTMNKKRKTLALWLLIGPTALVVASIILYAIINFITAATIPDHGTGAMFGTRSTLGTITNIALFLVSIVTFITWLPGIIIGIVLLANPKTS